MPALSPIGCVIAQVFFRHGASSISLKFRVFSVELNVIYRNLGVT